MAVLIEAISVVVRADAILERFPVGWDGFKDMVPNRTLCADNEIARVGFMSPADVKSFVRQLEGNGLVFLRDDESIDIVVVDQVRGPSIKCDWVEFGHIPWHDDDHQIAACRLRGSKVTQLVMPLDWVYEKSLSAAFGFQPTEHAAKGLEFLRHEDGLDVYRSRLTGEEVYVGRTGRN